MADGVRRLRRAAVRVLHAGHRRAHQGADRQEGRRPHPRRGRPPPRCPPVPLHRLHRRSSTPSRRSPATRSRWPSPPGGVGTRGVKYEGCELAVGRRPFIDDMRARRPAARRVPRSPTTPAPTSSPSTPRAAEAVPGVERVLTAADVPGELRVGIIHKDWPVFIPVGGRTSYLGDVLADGRRRRPGHGAPRRRAGRGHLRRPRADRRPGARVVDHRRAGGVGARRQRVVDARPTPAATSTPRSPPRPTRVDETFQTQRIEHAFLEPESTLAVPTAPTAASTSTRAARASGTTATTSPRMLGVDPSQRHRRARLQRRRVRRQGGHVEPGARPRWPRGSWARR